MAARLERNRATASHVEQTNHVAVFDDRFPTEQILHSFEQRANTAATIVGNRAMPLDREHELLMLGTDTKLRLAFAARFEPRNEFLARLDRRHVDLVASHAGGSDGKGRDLTRRPQGRAIGSCTSGTTKCTASARAATISISSPAEPTTPG